MMEVSVDPRCADDRVPQRLRDIGGLRIHKRVDSSKHHLHQPKTICQTLEQRMSLEMSLIAFDQSQ